MHTTQTPTTLRRLGPCVATLLLMLLPAASSAQTDWTIDDAVRTALARPEIREIEDARLASVRAELQATTARENPTLSLEHERVFGPLAGDGSEFAAVIEQPFDVARWRRALLRTAQHREAALLTEVDAWELEMASSVREAFYAVHYRQARLATWDAWVARLEDGVASVSARTDRGDASTYEALRMERELAVARAQRATESAAMGEAWAQLEQWTGWPGPRQLAGALHPEARRQRAPEEPVEVERLRHVSLSLSAEEEAWGSPFLRGWTVGAGYRNVRSVGADGHGFVVSLGVPLALRNTDRPRIAQLHAQQAEIRAQIHSHSARAERQAAAAEHRLDEALAALASLAVAEDDTDLSHLAQLAFEAGEATLVDLLDALESEADLQLVRIDLQWEACRAAIALDRSLGVGAEP